MTTNQTTLLTGTSDLIDQALREAGYGHTSDLKRGSHKDKTTCIALSERGRSGLDVAELVSKLYTRIWQNWESVTRRIPSPKNWELRQRIDSSGKVILADANNDPEIVLERRIVQAALNSNRTDWFHQCPTASGVFSATTDRCHIDLIQKLGDEEFQLIELKVASDNPLFAAFELVRNCLLYLLARRQLSEHYTDKPLLSARKMRLVVLAPRSFYCCKPNQIYDLGWFEKDISAAIAECGKDQCEINFAFEAFPEWFGWPPEKGTMRDFPDERLLQAVDERRKVFAT